MTRGRHSAPNGVARDEQLAELGRETVRYLKEPRRIVDDMRPSVLELRGLCDASRSPQPKRPRGAWPTAVHFAGIYAEGTAVLLADDFAQPGRRASSIRRIPHGRHPNVGGGRELHPRQRGLAEPVVTASTSIYLLQVRVPGLRSL